MTVSTNLYALTNIYAVIPAKKDCKGCNSCKKYCSDYAKRECEHLPKKSSLCNGCTTKAYCRLDQRFYDAAYADKAYRDSLVNSRNGFDLTAEEIISIDDTVSPLLKKGMSPYSIKASLNDKLIISESTLRRMIDNNELEARNIDLRDKVKRKPRRKSKDNNYKKLKIIKDGHKYEDYLNFIQDYDGMIWQMDCVEGVAEDSCAILTLHCPALHMQLIFIMPEHTSDCVVETLNKIETAIGKKLYRQIFELILTDNGHEFSNIDGMEFSPSGEKRSHIFFCEPNRSDEKGAAENNHKLIRYVIPKRTSIDEFMQSDMTILANHINSYPRKSLFGKCPYDMAMNSLPDDFFILLGLEKIPYDSLNLTPALLQK